VTSPVLESEEEDEDKKKEFVEKGGRSTTLPQEKQPSPNPS
jgi:hypothetical protein